MAENTAQSFYVHSAFKAAGCKCVPDTVYVDDPDIIASKQSSE